MPARLTVTLVALLVLSSGRDGAASPAANSLTQRAAGAPAFEPRAPVDESALRYYAGLKQTARVEAETRRLQRLHPNWRPPTDLAAERPGTEDEAPLWELFAADKLEDLRAAIADRRTREPDWQPSTNLAAQLRRKEARAEITAASREGRWEEVARLAAARRADLDPSDVALSWTIAEAFGRTDRAADTVRVLRAVLEAPGSTEAERSATIHAALAFLPMDEAEGLISIAEGRGDGPNGLGAIAVDITRARLSAFLRGRPGREVAAEEMKAFEDHARASDDPSQAGLVAWYAFKRRDWAEALTWFKLAIARGGGAMVAHGLAHTLNRLGFAREAEEVAYAWREPLVNNAVLFIDLVEAEMTGENPPPIEPDRLRRFAEVTLTTASGEGAQALAWYAYNTCQFDTALEWFRRAVAWFPKQATVQGYAVTLQRLKRHREFVEVVNRYDGLFPDVVELLFHGPRQPASLACEQERRTPAAAAPPGEGRYLDLAAPQARLAEAAAGATVGTAGWGRVPQPGAGQGTAVPLVKRSDFPVAVPPENDLRFPSTVALTAATSGARAAGPARWRERAAGVPPLVARRVVGVGVLPYERFGYALLPAWDGTDAPSAPIAVERPPPLGTLWAEETGPPQPPAAKRPARPEGEPSRTTSSRFQR